MGFNSKSGIDLHIHTTASDGSYSPVEIIALADQMGLRAIAITDHDTVDGVKEAVENGIPSTLEFITGVEISAAPPSFFEAPGSFHMLGYGFQPDHEALNTALEELQMARGERNPKIVDCLKRLGFDISMDEVRAEAGDGLVGRPHIATVMVKKGIVESFGEAFDLYLGAGQPAHVDKFRIPCDKAIQVIRQAGGIPVLAHPCYLDSTGFDAGGREKFETLVISLKRMGLLGIEVHYPAHDPEMVKYFLSLCEKYQLMVTGGTDFHGKINQEIQLGTGRGDLFVPYRLFESLKDSVDGRK